MLLAVSIRPRRLPGALAAVVALSWISSAAFAVLRSEPPRSRDRRPEPFWIALPPPWPPLSGMSTQRGTGWVRHTHTNTSVSFGRPSYYGLYIMDDRFGWPWPMWRVVHLVDDRSVSSDSRKQYPTPQIHTYLQLHVPLQRPGGVRRLPLVPHIPGMAGLLVVATACYSGVVLLVCSRRRRLGLCAACAYPSPSAGGPCPECGCVIAHRLSKAL